MKGHAIRGKTVKKLHQVLWESNAGKVWIVDAIEFTDGTFLRFLVAEGEGDYGVEAIYPARPVE